jgi:hypothetical protein
MRVVTIGTSHDYAPGSPTIQPLAVRAAGPGFSLGEMTLSAEAITVIQSDPLAGLERQHVDRRR